MPSEPAPGAGLRTGPPTGEQLAGLAVLAAIAAQQAAAYAADLDAAVAPQRAAAMAAEQEAAVAARPTFTTRRPRQQPRYADGDQLAGLLAEIEAARRQGPGSN